MEPDKGLTGAETSGGAMELVGNAKAVYAKMTDPQCFFSESAGMLVLAWDIDSGQPLGFAWERRLAGRYWKPHGMDVSR